LTKEKKKVGGFPRRGAKTWRRRVYIPDNLLGLEKDMAILKVEWFSAKKKK